MADIESLFIDEVKRRGRLFYRLAFGILRDAQAAEDVCQQAFLKAWQRRGQLRSSDALPAWLTRVVTNESLQAVRRRQRVQPVDATDWLAETGSVGADERDERRQHIQAALAELPEQTRAIVVLRLIEGLSGKEVTALLGLSAPEVSRRLHQGMEQLRHKLIRTSVVD